jgi:hypothetical protein
MFSVRLELPLSRGQILPVAVLYFVLHDRLAKMAVLREELGAVRIQRIRYGDSSVVVG